MNEIYVENQPIFTKVLNVINNKSKFHQAYILVNEDKKKLDEYAFLLSSVLICPEKYKKECTKCNICHRIRNNVFGELKVIKPSNNTIKKEEIISLRNEFQTSSIEGKNRVYIINDVELLNTSAANSILKFLEEPEGNTIAIFTTTNLSKVINTIVSRCQIIKLNNIKIIEKQDFMQKNYNLKKEDIDKIVDFVYLIETDIQKAICIIKEQFIKDFSTKEMLKNAMEGILLYYKDVLNYKLFSKAEYFSNYEIMKKISEIQSVEKITKKIAYILENIEKLDYNVNMLLYVTNLLIEIGEINDGKSSRN